MRIGKQSLQELFAPVSEQSWWERVEKDLKGKALESLHWSPQTDVELRPFYKSAPALTVQEAQQADWWVTETVQVKQDAKQSNQQALQALRGGANALRFELNGNFSDWEKLFEGIHFTYIHSQFTGILDEQAATALLHAMEQMLSQQEADLSELSIDIQLSETPSPEFLQRAIDAPYTLRVLAVEVPEGQEYSAQIAYIFQQFEALVQKFSADYSFSQLAQQLHVYWGVGQSYFPELAKFRAFQHLWLHWLEAHGLEKALTAPIHAYTRLENRADNPYWDMIAATTQAMSAVLGGCSSLSITPAPLPAEQQRFAKRVARNVQHLLKHESHLHRVVDPSAGAYYIETLSQQLAQKAWETFSVSVR